MIATKLNVSTTTTFPLLWLLSLTLLISRNFCCVSAQDNNFAKLMGKAHISLSKSDFLEKRQNQDDRKLDAIGIQLVGEPAQRYFHGTLEEHTEETILEVGPFEIVAKCNGYSSAIELNIGSNRSEDVFLFGSISGDPRGSNHDINEYVLLKNDTYSENMWSVSVTNGADNDPDTGAFFATDGYMAWYVAIFGDTTIGFYQNNFGDNSEEEIGLGILEGSSAVSNSNDDCNDNSNCFFAGGLTYYQSELIAGRRRNQKQRRTTTTTPTTNNLRG